MDLMDHGWPHRHAPATHGLRVGHLGSADTGEVAIHQIGADLALQYRIAPVSDVLQNQQSQHHFGGETGLPRRRLWGWRCTNAWWTAETIASSASIASTCTIHGSCRSLISAVMNPSPKLRCARRTSIKRPPVRVTHYHCLSPGQVAYGLRVAPSRICDSITAFSNLF